MNSFFACTKILELILAAINAPLSQELFSFRTYKFSKASELQGNAHTTYWSTVPVRTGTAKFPPSSLTGLLPLFSHPKHWSLPSFTSLPGSPTLLCSHSTAQKCMNISSSIRGQGGTHCAAATPAPCRCSTG